MECSMNSYVCIGAIFLFLLHPSLGRAQVTESSFDRLQAALLADTPLEHDLEDLADTIGGRATGSPANARAVDWALSRFRTAGVKVQKEVFEMPNRWLERSARAMIRGTDVDFSPRVAAMPFSAATPATGM